MASTLETLPNDILQDILDLLSRKDLLNLSLVSSRITSPAQRVLYRSISLRLNAPRKPDSTYTASTGNLHIFTRLVDMLSQNPHISQYISTLSIEVFHHVSVTRFKDHDDLLRLVPQLKSLTLNPPPNHLQLSNLPLPHLKMLNMIYDSGEEVPANERKGPLEIMARQFWMPSLRKISLDVHIFSPEMRLLFPPDRYRTSPIMDLQFQSGSEQDVGCLPDILLCVKSLERFTIEVRCPWEANHSPTRMAPGAIGQCIGPHASTLVQLEIAGSDAAEFAMLPLFGSLAGFPKLKRLAIPEPFLVLPHDEISTLVDVLPPNLEELQLQYPMLRTQGKDIYRATRIKRVEQLAAAKLVRFPSLRRVIWWIQPAECWDDGVGNRYGSVDDMQHLAAAFDKVGVKFEWLCYAYFEGTPFRPEDDEPGN